ncbi:MAG: hypothetical protein LUD72_10800 [Bacteroidales bacterium]|nr:hypothetical protein [Bacteroidales bacterium]
MADEGLITREDMAEAREIEFVEQFNETVTKLMEALGTTRQIPKEAGTVLKCYEATGELQDGIVDEGEDIPLSHYKVEAKDCGEITLKKWRKATSAEAIVDGGYNQAVEKTTDRMLKDVQKAIRKDFFDFLATGTGVASGDTFQSALAQAWGQLQVLFDDDDVDAVYFMNPLDVADYLGTADVTMQSAFGMSYIEDFMGLGTVLLNSNVEKGKIYATAKENVVLYYVPVNGADLNNAFEFTSDETGYIGIHEEANYTNMTASDTVVNGMALFAERIDGVVVSTIAEG